MHFCGFSQHYYTLLFFFFSFHLGCIFFYFLFFYFFLFLFYFIFFLSSLTAVPSENQCLSSGAYEWPVLVSLKHAVGLSQHWFLLQEWPVQRKPQ